MTPTEAVAARPGSAGPTQRLFVSLSLIAAVSALGFIPLPGIDVPELKRILRTNDWSVVGNLSIGATGISPIISGFLAAELGALIVPRWRYLREPAGRAKLRRAANTVSIVMAAFQGFGIAMYAEGLEGISSAHGWGNRFVVMATIAAFTALVVLALAVNERSGLGSGLSFFMAATWIGSAGLALTELEPSSLAGVLAHAGPAMAVVAIATVALLASPRSRADQGAVGVAPLASGLVPLSMSRSAVYLVMLAGPVTALLQGSTGIVRHEAAFELALIVLFAIGWAALFHPIGDIARMVTLARHDPRADGGPETTDERTRHDTRSSLRTATGRTILFLGFLSVLPSVATADLGSSPESKVVGSFLDPSRWAVLACIALDLWAEWRARSSSVGGGTEGGRSDWIVVAVEHRVYAARILAWSLEQRGIAVLARGLYARTCFHFFGPYIPIEILVPPRQKEEAGAIVDRVRGAR